MFNFGDKTSPAVEQLEKQLGAAQLQLSTLRVEAQVMRTCVNQLGQDLVELRAASAKSLQELSKALEVVEMIVRDHLNGIDSAHRAVATPTPSRRPAVDTTSAASKASRYLDELARNQSDPEVAEGMRQLASRFRVIGAR